MKENEKICAQGELTIVRLDSLTDDELHAIGLKSRHVPKDARSVKRGGQLVVGHSESGHHHVIESPCAEQFETSDPLVCFLRLEAPAALEHCKPGDPHQHGSHTLPAGTYRVTRQREMGPLGWRQVQD